MKNVVSSLVVILVVGCTTVQAGKAINGYGGLGLSVIDGGLTASKDNGFHLTAGVGRDISRLGEVVLKGTYTWFGERPFGHFGMVRNLKAGDVGLYFKLNLRKERQRSFVYLLAGGGGLAVSTWRTTTTFYSGVGIGGVLDLGDAGKPNLELRWLMPPSESQLANPYVLLTIGLTL